MAKHNQVKLIDMLSAKLHGGKGTSVHRSTYSFVFKSHRSLAYIPTPLLKGYCKTKTTAQIHPQANKKANAKHIVSLYDHLSISISTASLLSIISTSTCLCRCSRFEGLNEIMDNIVDVFGSNRNTDQVLDASQWELLQEWVHQPQ